MWSFFIVKAYHERLEDSVLLAGGFTPDHYKIMTKLTEYMGVKNYTRGMIKGVVNGTQFFILLSLSILSVVGVLPYVLTIQADVLQQIGQPVAIIALAQIAQSVIFFSIAIFLGLFFTKKIQFQLPLLDALLEKGDYTKVLKTIVPTSVLLGIATALAIFLLDPLFSALGAGISTHQNLAPAWQKLLAAFYGGITEELLMRLLVMSFLIWIGMKVCKRTQPANLGIWIAIIVAAVFFGLGHLPITASVTTITPLIIVRAIVLNGVGGIVFGWLFWKKGLESAMIAHFTTDVFLLTLFPLFIG